MRASAKKSYFRILGIFIIIFAAFFAVIFLSMVVSKTLKADTVAVIDIKGIISRGDDFFGAGINPDEFLEMAREANESEAVIIRINSPGGSVVASKEIFEAIKEIDKPKICLMLENAASGALWVSMACDYIIADSLTLTGSIGATSSYIEFSELLSKYGIEYVNLTSGKFKDMGIPFRNITSEERKMFEEILKEVVSEFKQVIANSRGLDIKKVEEIADGRIFLGKDALAFGLIDELGNFNTALKMAEKVRGKSLRPIFIERREKIDLLRYFLSGKNSLIIEDILKNYWKMGLWVIQ
jgi:protease-4